MTSDLLARRTLDGADRLCNTTVVAFAVWTVCAHAAVFSGLGLDALIWTFAAASLAATAAWRLLLPAEPAAREVTALGSPVDEPPSWQRAGVAVGAGLCGLAFTLDAPLVAVWGAGALLVVVVSLREFLSRHGSPEGPEEDAGDATVSRGALLTLALLAILCATVALTSHRPDADDGFYLNLAVAAVDDPAAPLLANDTLHRVPDVPLTLPVYRVHSLELLEAAASRVTRRPVLDVAHLWLPGLAALFVPLVWARLLRRLTPRAWPWAVTVAIAHLVFTAAASHGWANFGLLRLHQGKGLLLTLAVPLTLAYALDFARRGTLRDWLRLAAVQIGAVGLSASALWLAPLAAAPALVAGLGGLPRTASLRRLAIGLAASAYVLGVAFAVRGATIAAFRDAPIPGPESALSSLQLATQAVRAVVGSGWPGAFALVAPLLAWSVSRSRVARRFCAFTALVAWLLWNPVAAEWIGAWLTSAPAYWRVLWLLPMPALFAVVLTSPIESERLDPRLARAAATLGAVAVFGGSLWLAPGSLAVSPANGVQLAAPSWKVPSAEFDAARAIALAAEPSDLVLAPTLVAPWVPTFHQHPTPLVVRREYLPVLHAKLGRDELTRRLTLMRIVSGQSRAAAPGELLRSALRDDGVAVVGLAASARRSPQLLAALGDSGFQKIHANTDYDIWARKPEEP